jgi:hypothetical protein
VLTELVPTHGRGWAIVQLSDIGELASAADIDADFMRRVPDCRCFFPSTLPSNPLSHYALIVADLPSMLVLRRLERSVYVESVLFDDAPSRKPAIVTTLPDDEVKRLLYGAGDVPKPRSRLPIGARVKPTEGVWAGVEGRVVENVRDKVAVYFCLHSVEKVVVLPRTAVAVEVDV